MSTIPCASNRESIKKYAEQLAPQLLVGEDGDHSRVMLPNDLTILGREIGKMFYDALTYRTQVKAHEAGRERANSEDFRYALEELIR